MIAFSSSDLRSEEELRRSFSLLRASLLQVSVIGFWVGFLSSGRCGFSLAGCGNCYGWLFDAVLAVEAIGKAIVVVACEEVLKVYGG